MSACHRILNTSNRMPNLKRRSTVEKMAVASTPRRKQNIEVLCTRPDEAADTGNCDLEEDKLGIGTPLTIHSLHERGYHLTLVATVNSVFYDSRLKIFVWNSDRDIDCATRKPAY